MNPSPLNSKSTGNNSSGAEAEDGSCRNTRKRRRSEAEMDTENTPANPNRPGKIENGLSDAPSPNRDREGPLAPLNNSIPSPSPPLSQSRLHHLHQGPRHVCKICPCEYGFDNVTDLLRHTNHHHSLFKLKHYRLRKVPQCLVCSNKSTLILGSTEDFITHVYECLQRKRKDLGPKWEPDFKPQVKYYLAVDNPTAKWYEQLEDSPASFTQEEYNQIMEGDSSSTDEESESVDPEESAGSVSESPSDTDNEHDDEQLNLNAHVCIS